MKTKHTALTLMLLALSGTLVTAAPMGTAFTYQGQLWDGTNAANGLYDLSFTLYDAAGGGNVVAGPGTNVAVTVANGLFTTSVDFGSAVFNGDARWLEVAARTNGAANFSTFLPRQPITPTPYALDAANAAAFGGQLPGYYAPASGSSAYVAKSGDTMTGPLSSTYYNFNGNPPLPTTITASIFDQQYVGPTVSGLSFDVRTGNPPYWDFGSRLRIDASGNVGIGTTTPAARLQVIPAGTFDGIKIGAVDTTGATSLGLSLSGPTNGYADIQAVRGQGVAWGDIVLNRQGGHVGIGTTTPSCQLSLGDNSANTKFALWEGGGTVMGMGVANQQFQLHLPDPYNRFAFLDTPGGNELMTIKGNGNVGIGTTSPGALLDLFGAGPKLQQLTPTTSTNAVYTTWQNDTTHRSVVGNDNSSGNNILVTGGAPYALTLATIDSCPIVMATANAERLRVDTSGNVGIGTTSPQAKLEVNGTIGFVPSDFAANNASDGFWTVKADSTDANKLIFFEKGGAGVGIITPRVSLDHAGNVGIGTTSPSATLDVAGNLTYSGQLGKLDTAENWNATVRAADFLLGYSTRRGTPGRALVDLGNSLSLNHDGDWPATDISGNVYIRMGSAGGNLEVAGTVRAAAFQGDGSGLTGISTTVVTNTGWGLSGNSGTGPANFLGTTDGQALELRVAGKRGLRLEPSSYGTVNVIAGSAANSAAAGVIGATIAGGGNRYGSPLYLTFPNSVNQNFGTIAGGANNQVNSLSASIGGGDSNQILSGSDGGVIGGGAGNVIQASASVSTIGGGTYNVIAASAPQSVISGGWSNSLSSWESTIAGGGLNTVGTGGQGSVVGGGHGNTILPNSSFCTIPGGIGNVAGGAHSFAAGYRAKAVNTGSFVWADYQEADFTSTGPDQFLVRASGGVGINTTPSQAFGASRALTLQANYNQWLAFNDNITSTTLWHADGLNQGLNFHHSGATPYVLCLSSADRVGICTNNPQTTLHVNGTTRTCILEITGGCDVAEPFEMSTADIPKGSVVIIDEKNPGHLKLSERAYDHRVAGIVSGANGIQPGLTLSQQGVAEGGQHVALSGRVYAIADASSGAINPGDLLTTSSIPGHAMKVTDHAKAQGAIIGKAMTGLSEGQGLVLVLVSLQ